MIMQAVYTLKNFHYGDSIASAQGWDIQKLQMEKVLKTARLPIRLNGLSVYKNPIEL